MCISPRPVVPATVDQAVQQQGTAADGEHLSLLHPSEEQGLMPPTHFPIRKTWMTLYAHCSFPNSVTQYA